VARSSAFSLKGKHIDLRIVGEQLKVRTVLEGSVRRVDDRLRITAQLVNSADGYHLWSQRSDREMKDIFAIQDEIARSIAQQFSGRQLAEGMTQAKLAVESDPLSGYAHALYALTCMDIGKLAEAIEACRRGLETNITAAAPPNTVPNIR
jgi:hypothetical protein